LQDGAVHTSTPAISALKNSEYLAKKSQKNTLFGDNPDVAQSSLSEKTPFPSAETHLNGVINF
jgi:hypothetical protein